MLFQEDDENFCKQILGVHPSLEDAISANPPSDDFLSVLQLQRKPLLDWKDGLEMPDAFAEPQRDKPADQFLSVLELQRKSDGVVKPEPVSERRGMRTRSKANSKPPRTYGGSKRKKVPKKTADDKKKEETKLPVDDVENKKKLEAKSAVDDVWMPLSEKTTLSDLYSINLDIDVVDNFLNDAQYEDNYENLLSDYETKETRTKESVWLVQWGDNDQEEVGRHPPPQHTGGKWRPFQPPETGGKWKNPSTSTATYGRPASHPSPSHTSGKWAPGASAPPVGHTKGKWLPSAESSGKAAPGGSIEYFCSTCRRRLASKEMYRRHLMSDFHLLRVLDENDLECDVRSLKRRKDADRKRIVKKPAKYESENIHEKAALRKRKRMTECAPCKVKIRRGKVGKHLVSYHHFQRCKLRDSSQINQLLDNMDSIIKQSPYQCSPCHFYCNTPAQFRAHWEQPHEHAEDVDRECYWWCSFCKFSCVTAAEMRVHLDGEQHGEVLQSLNGSMPVVIRCPESICCEICHKEFYLRVRLQRHMAAAHHVLPAEPEPLKCGACDFVTTSRKSMQTHGSRVHGNARAGLQPYCTVCALWFESTKLSDEHRATAAHRYAIEKKNHPKSTSLERKCTKCSEVLATPLQLSEHTTRVHGDDHICVKCGMVFPASQHVTWHTKKAKCTFPNEPLLSGRVGAKKCSKCAFTCTFEADLLYHSTLHTTQETDIILPCAVCSKLFLRKRLRNHLRIHTGELPEQCQDCKKTFTSARLLHNHLATGCKIRDSPKVNREKKFKCNQCNYTAKTRTLLTRHLLIHGGGEKLDCPHCDYQAKTLDYLRKHLSCHINSKPFKCPHCSYTSSLMENLRKHVMKTDIHKGRLLYDCKWCNFATNTTNDFDRHLAEKHPEHYNPDDKKIFWGIYTPQEPNTLD